MTQASKNYSLSQIGNIVTTNANGAITSLNTSTYSANLGPVGNVTITGGSNGQVLTTNGSGNLTWTTVTSGSAAAGMTSAMGTAGNAQVSLGSMTFNTVAQDGGIWATAKSNYGVGGRLGVNWQMINYRNGGGTYSASYGSFLFPAAGSTIIGTNNYISVGSGAGGTIEMRSIWTGECFSLTLATDGMASKYHSLSLRVPNPVNVTAMDSVVSALLSTNKTAFNSASAGAAVEITAAEYAALIAGVPNTTKYGATDAVMATVPSGSNSTTFNGGYSEGNFAVESKSPAARYHYAFSTRVVATSSSGNLVVQQCLDNDALIMLHYNQITVTTSTTQRYFAVKSAPYRMMAVGGSTWISVQNYKYTSGSSTAYGYLAAGVPADGSASSDYLANTGNTPGRPYVQYLCGTPA